MRLLILLCVFSVALAAAEQRYDLPAPEGLRPSGTLGQTLPALPLVGMSKTVQREVRNYPEQPPVVPHAIRGYQLDKSYNHCLHCHSRARAPSMGAPMVSVPHFMDGRQQVRATVAARRYFCTQCHVTQTQASPLVETDFLSVEAIIRSETAQ